ncbi:2-isopropylmalate synthase [Thiomicrorhabdus heinhorstiae]|uniref:2-isopropylmalate synthase n=2 Tax=Thiomicrorhabdus heinhorstiae TaxID=2748010 RepID=A0ABS0C0A0_9GAMM|nr:2-isopropylmalate synthase [Thiomicrorhabdus heinhorstiae]MBF6057767.1 2-isopropylmalate synthase [Thiomicrorhabdus heinhorstiae]
MNTMNFHKYRPTVTPDLPNRQWPNRRLTKAPIWVSVDLRDGNQALAKPMTVEQKLKLWDKLVSIGFKTIEIGFPSASQLEFDFTRRLIEENRIPDDVTVQVLVQAREHLIQRTYEALEGVKQAVVHVYNTTSQVQRDNVFCKNKQQIKQIAVDGATWVQEYAKHYPLTDWVFQYSPESFSQTETDYAVEVCQAVMDVWKPTPQNKCILNLPATVESSSPNRFADQIEYFITHMQNRESAIISVHTHNDRGCAVAAAELAILAGADRVEGTLLGNGERTGNMDIVTLAMNLYSEGIDPQLDFTHPDEWVEVVEEVTQISTHIRHPWVGQAVYTAYSGSHQDAIRKCLLKQNDDQPWNVAYLPIDPKDIGRDYEAIIRVNSQSDVEFLKVQLNGQTWQGMGQGTLSAVCDAYQKQSGQSIDIIDYSEHALHDPIPDLHGNTGKDAMAIAYVYLKSDQGKKVGVAIAQDTVSAMILAFFNATI